MKATGIVRRIDDLGRVVIPKEIRRTMRIREGDPLEIYTDREGEVIFKKYSPVGEFTEFASVYAETLHKTSELCVVICDRDSVVASAGIPKREISDRRISDEAEELITNRTKFAYRGEGGFDIVGSPSSGRYVSCLMPIITEGDVIGCVATLFPQIDSARHRASDVEQKLIETAAAFLARQLES